MVITGIVAEYNPFHNGHKFQICETKKKGATHIIAVMSGHFVQRGDISCFDKWTRTKIALLNGVDLVIELPVNFSCSSAETFCFGAVSILDSLGCVDYISFGSECGDIEIIKKLAEIILNFEKTDEIQEFLIQGFSYPKSLSLLLEKYQQYDLQKVLNKPNNTLGIEYIKSLIKLNSNIEPITISRNSVEHNSNFSKNNFASGSYIRNLIYQNKYDEFNKLVPENSIDIYNKLINKNLAPASCNNLENIILYKLRSMSKQDFIKIPDVSEGLENRLFEAAQKACSVGDFFDLVKCKKYTMAKLRRIVFNCLIDLDKNKINNKPDYIRVLGANKKGFEILKKVKQTCEIPIVNSFVQIEDINPYIKNIEQKSTDVFGLSTPTIIPCGEDYYKNQIILKEGIKNEH